MNNEKSKLNYHYEGDYLIPNLAIKNSKTDKYKIGKYGCLRLQYLKENKKGLYAELMIATTLEKHLSDIDKEANQQVHSLVSKYAEAQNVNEKLKQSDPLRWVGLMNNFKNVAEEIVLNELIYN